MSYFEAMVKVNNMRRLFIIILCVAIVTCSYGQDTNKIKNLFLNLKYSDNIKALFDSVAKDSRFQLKTNRDGFMESAEFSAKFISTCNLFPNADSIILNVVTCNDMNTFFTPGASNCKALKVYYYLKDTSLVQANYNRLDSIITATIKLANPNWKNHEGTSRGAYYLAGDIYPYILLWRSWSKGDKPSYLSILYTDYD